MNQRNENKNKPTMSWKAGGVSAALFENERVVNGKQFTTKNVVVERNYQDREGNWKKTSSFNGVADLVKARLVMSNWEGRG